MSSQLSLENFEEIYNNTYTYTLRYILCKCSNIDDVNDLLQETYVELYKILKTKKNITLENYQNYIIGIAKKKTPRNTLISIRRTTRSLELLIKSRKFVQAFTNRGFPMVESLYSKVILRTAIEPASK